MDIYLDWLESKIRRLQIERDEDSLCITVGDIIEELYGDAKVSTFYTLIDWYSFLHSLEPVNYIHVIKIKFSDPVTETRFRHFIHLFILVQHGHKFYLCDSWEGIHRFKCRRYSTDIDKLNDTIVQPIIDMLDRGVLDGNLLTCIFNDETDIGWAIERELLESEGMDTEDFHIPVYEFNHPYRNDILINTYSI